MILYDTRLQDLCCDKNNEQYTQCNAIPTKGLKIVFFNEIHQETDHQQ